MASSSKQAAPALSDRDKRAIAQARAMRDDAWREGIAIVGRVARRNPSSPDAWREYTFALMGPYEQKRCRAALARWRTLSPDDPLLACVEAALAYSSTDFEQALTWAKVALARDPHNFEVLWAKAMSERFLRLPESSATFAAAEASNPARFAEEMERTRSVESFAPLEFQNSFERIVMIGTAADEGDAERAKRLLALSKAELVLPEALAELLDKAEARIVQAERRGRARLPTGRAPVRPGRRRA